MPVVFTVVKDEAAAAAAHGKQHQQLPKVKQGLKFVNGRVKGKFVPSAFALSFSPVSGGDDD